MKKVFPKLLVSALAAVTLAACSTNPSTSANASAESTVTLTPAQVSGQFLVAATAWVQNAGEYRALSYQAFNYATLAFDNAKAVKGKAKAVVVDLDETMIDNAAYQGGVAKYGIPFSSQTWGKWEREGNPKVSPGALEFAKYVTSKGGKVFYVSNRRAENWDATQATLKALGFPEVTKETLLLKDKESNKNARFAQAGQNYNVVLYVGDNLQDFPDTYKIRDNAGRIDWVDANRKNFGVKYIVLPNPMYGSWISTLVPDFYKNSLSGQNQIILDAIKAWDLSNFK
ncbi:5'-nucleotidase, lipoprotein e(P4) family [Psittacicella hinzii]|uniref:5'-nucleotidase, lipoprotein e(P4) family n=1 Tax=Psittacicella hinzii TaxID=2028575 RepID=UPI001CA6C88D|nr:5'-nucleotidase, lipoprotein e(P4) family [Psittacicella hinzii]